MSTCRTSPAGSALNSAWVILAIFSTSSFSAGVLNVRDFDTDFELRSFMLSDHARKAKSVLGVCGIPVIVLLRFGVVITSSSSSFSLSTHTSSSVVANGVLEGTDLPFFVWPQRAN